MRRDTCSRTDPYKALAWPSESLSWGLWDISPPLVPRLLSTAPRRDPAFAFKSWAARSCPCPDGRRFGHARQGSRRAAAGRCAFLWPRAGGGRRGAVAACRRWGATAAISRERPGPAAAVGEKRRRAPPEQNSDWEARAPSEAGRLSSR